MICSVCGMKIVVGDKVYPGSFNVWHTTCDSGACYAIMGGDGKLRWAGGNCVKGTIGRKVIRKVISQERYE